MNTVKVKICGIQNMESACMAIDAGADFLGFNFAATSKRYITPTKAQKIIRNIKGKIKIVGIFQDEDIQKVKKIIQEVDLDYVQLHGKENAQYILQLHFPVIKTFPLFGDTQNFVVDYFLFDRATQGTGSMVTVDVTRKINTPFFLAGGLTPENVASKVRQIKPFAVDVASGIETNGITDFEKIRKFVRNAKGAYI